MDFEYARRCFREGKRIIDTFKERGLTMPQAYSLMELYARDHPYPELREAVGIKNLGQFSNNVIMPLRKKRYIERAKIPDNKIKITKEGRYLVERVLSKI